jgi:DUF4097 and DUF4098 domain-containing protein YvlB
MKPGKVVLLLFILAFGAAVQATWMVHEELALGPLGCRVLRGKFYGPSFSYDEETRAQLPAGASLDVSNAFGSVRVLRGEAGEARITLRKVVYMASEGEARAFASRIRPQAELKSTVLHVSTNRNELEAKGTDGRDVGFETHLEIALPPGTAATVRNEHGSVDVRGVSQADVTASFEPLRVEGVTGSVRVVSRHGAVAVSEVGGDLDLSAQHGNVTVEDVAGKSSVKLEHGDLSVARAGELVLETAHGDVELEDVRGGLTLRGHHSAARAREVAGRLSMTTSHGDLTADSVKGDAELKADHGGVTVTDAGASVSVEASFEDVSLTRVAGPVEVKVEHGGVHCQHLARGGRIKTKGDDVSVDGFSGALWIEAERGSVQIVPSGALQESLTVSASFGSIDLAVPTGSRIDLEAEASQGDVTVDLPGLTRTESSETRVKGTYEGGGIPVKLLADHGEIRIQTPAKVATVER